MWSGTARLLLDRYFTLNIAGARIASASSLIGSMNMRAGWGDPRLNDYPDSLSDQYRNMSREMWLLAS